MIRSEFIKLMDGTFARCKALSDSKGIDYTKGSEDALANFKEVGISIGIDPVQACWIFMNKHYQAITNYVKTQGESESEPIDGRIDDMINYLVLFKALLIEKRPNL